MDYRDKQLHDYLEYGICSNVILDIQEGYGLYESDVFVSNNFPTFEQWLKMSPEERKRYEHAS